VAAAQNHLAAELRRAAEYVRGLLPRKVRWRELRTDWVFLPSRDLGGDAFGYTRLKDGRIALYLLDVSGHGIEAALLSVSLLHRVNSLSRAEPELWDPERILSDLNASYRGEDQNNLYFSAWFGLWDPQTRTLRYASAGSPPAALLTPDEPVRELRTGGPAVGVNDGAEFPWAETEIPPKSVLYLFSDGIYEVRGADGRILGLPGFLSILEESNRSSGATEVEGIVRAVRAASVRGQFEDDVSLVGFQFDA
jgi:sigma-B regulation protein RsbU (phosphoserine phosphatase)